MAQGNPNPRLIERRCGGWLAISGRGDPVQIGVTAASESEAAAEFDRVRDHWRAILESEVAAEAAFAG